MSVDQPQSLHSVQDFVNSAQEPFGLSDAVCKGFIVFMKWQGKYYMMNEKDFIPYLKQYLGKAGN